MTTSDDCPIKGEALLQWNEDYSDGEWTKADPEVHVSLEYISDNNKFLPYFKQKYRIDEKCPYDSSGWVHHARLIPRKEQIRLGSNLAPIEQNHLELVIALTHVTEAFQKLDEVLQKYILEIHQHNWIEVTEMQDERQRFVCAFSGCEAEYEGPIK